MNRRDVKDEDPKSLTFTEWPTVPLMRPVATGLLKPSVLLHLKKKKKKESTMHKLVFFFFPTIVLQLHQLLSQSCHRHRYLSIIQPASSFPLKMWVKIDVCWLYCIFPALCSSEMNRTITWHLPFAENYHKKCIWFAPHWLHGRHSQAEGLRAQLQGRNLSNLYLAPLQQSLHALSEIMIL